MELERNLLWLYIDNNNSNNNNKTENEGKSHVMIATKFIF
jgi:hypothetical protein